LPREGRMDSLEFDSFTWPKRNGANEDSLVVGTHLELHYFGVADGVGGSIGGSIASQVAVMQAEAVIKKESTDDMLTIFRSVHKKMEDDKNLQNMATTFTLCVIKHNAVSVGPVGDSRLYQLRNSSIIYKTEDQTLYSNLSNRGAENIVPHYSNILSSALCPAHQYTLVSTELSLWPGDRLIICSDGVHKVISNKELTEISVGSSNIRSFTLKIKAVLRIRGISLGWGHDQASSAGDSRMVRLS